MSHLVVFVHKLVKLWSALKTECEHSLVEDF